MSEKDELCCHPFLTPNPVDKAFLNRIVNVIEDRFHLPEFDARALAGAVYLSRQHLNRKVKALTGLSTRDLIRFKRLVHARDLLKTNDGHIAEIAFMAGFQNPSYFTKCFRELFGCTPLECRRGTTAVLSVSLKWLEIEAGMLN